MSSDGFYCQNCSSPYVLTMPNKLKCATPITGCLNYSDYGNCSQCNGTQVLINEGLACAFPINNCSFMSTNGSYCQNCSSPYILTMPDKLKCASPITGCLNYSDYGNCSQCNGSQVLINRGFGCVSPITNCSVMSSDGSYCQNCSSPYVLTMPDKLKCANPITGCLNYSDYGNCSQCIGSQVLINGSLSCASPISNCSVMSADGSYCQTCSSPYISITSGTACVLEINGCINYSANGLCQNCSETMFLNPIFQKCMNIIQNCEDYNNNNTCSTCSNRKFVSQNMTSCVSIINDCISYSNDGLCQSCLFGAILAENDTFCSIPSPESTNYNTSIYSKISLKWLNITQSTFLPNFELSKILITLNDLNNFTISFNESYITLTSISTDIQSVLPLMVDLNEENCADLNLSMIQAGYYQIVFAFSVCRNNRIFQNTFNSSSLPNSFILSYQPQGDYYVGSQADIAIEVSKNGNPNKSNIDNNDSSFNKELFAILFSIFVFFAIAVVFFLIIMKLRKKALNQTKFPLPINLKEIESPVINEKIILTENSPFKYDETEPPVIFSPVTCFEENKI